MPLMFYVVCFRCFISAPFCPSYTCKFCLSDGLCMTLERSFLNRLLEAGATESSGYSPSCHLGNDVPPEQSSTVNVLQKIFLPSSDLWHMNNEFVSAALTKLPENGSFCPYFLL